MWSVLVDKTEEKLICSLTGNIQAERCREEGIGRTEEARCVEKGGEEF